MGAWTSLNANAIYGTEPAPVPEPAWGRATMPIGSSGSGKVYLTLYADLPRYDLRLGSSGIKVNEAVVIETEERLTVEQTHGMVTIAAPEQGSAGMPVIALDVTGL